MLFSGFLGHSLYIQLRELQPSTAHCPDGSQKGAKVFSSQVHPSLHIVGAGVSFSAKKHLYLITLLVKECHSQREFHASGHKERIVWVGLN